MNQRKAKQSISLTLDVELVQRLRALAESEERSLSQYTNLILRRYLRESGRAKAEAEQPAAGRGPGPGQEAQG